MGIIMENIADIVDYVENSDVIQMFNHFTNKYIITLLKKTEFTSHLVEHLPSRVITLILIYGGIILSIYELILNTGVYLGLWNHPADEVFDEIPVHCAHVYVSIRVMVEKEGDKRESLLEFPIVYHFEFSPDEYAHEDYGTDLKFLRQKVHDWFMSSQAYYLHKSKLKSEITLDDISLYNKKGKHLEGDDEYLCDLNVNTGETVLCVIQGSD